MFPVRIRWAGQRAGLPLDMVSILTTMVTPTAHNTGLTLTLWPEFTGADLRRAVDSHTRRDRRFGAVAPASVLG